MENYDKNLEIKGYRISFVADAKCKMEGKRNGQKSSKNYVSSE